MAASLGRSWPGVPQEMWPALNRLAEGVETALNWRTDESIQIQLQGGYMTASVPPPTDFDTVILAGVNPYCWAKLNQFKDGKWYVDTATPLVGWIAGYEVVTLRDATWSGGVGTFFLSGNSSTVPFTSGQSVTVKGTDPIAWDATYTITSINQQELSFTAAITTDPDTYVTGGAVVGAVTDNDAFRPGYEINDHTTVPVGARSRMRVHVLNATESADGADDAPEYEHQFTYQDNCDCPLYPEPPRLLIQDEGTSLPKRPTLNFIGTSVTAADNTTSQRTDVTITLSSTTLPSSLGGWWNNLLINGGWNYAQRQTPGTLTTISDQAYSADRWKIEQENAGLQYQRLDGTGETSIKAKWYGRFKKITNAGQFIVYQWVLGQNSFPLRGLDGYYTVWMKSNAIRNMKAAVIVLGSGGTINAPPTPIVSSYGPFDFVANVTSGGTGTLAVGTDWTGFGGVAMGLSTSLLNIGFAFWTEDNFAINDTLDVAMTQMGLGDGVSVVRPWMERHAKEELALCRHFYRKSFNVDTPPSQGLGVGTGEMTCGAQAIGAITNRFQRVMFDPPMWGTPAVTTYNPAAANAEVRDETSAGDCSATAANDIEETGFDISTTGNAGTIAGEKLGVHWSAVLEIP